MRRPKVRKFAVADCETDPFAYRRVVTPFIWGFYSPEYGYLEFNTTESFVEFAKEYDGIIYLHNGGRFDSLFLLPWIDGKVLRISGRLASAHLGKCELRDSYCILPVPLSAYKKDDFEYWKLEESERHLYMDEISDYLRGDCVYLFEIIERFVNEYGQYITLASAAMAYWVNKFAPPCKFPRGDSGARWFNTFKHYYTGGRVQCFKQGEFTGKFGVWDINSAYPKAMCTDIPYGFGTFVTRRLIEEKMSVGFFDVVGTSNGAFPVKEDHKTNYPYQSGNFSVPGPELQAALKAGTFKLDRVERAIYFDNSVNFSPYINHFYEMKLKAKINGDKAAYIFAKLFMNSLYGKYGANPSKYKECKVVRARDLHKYPIKTKKNPGGWDHSLIAGDQYIVEKPIKLAAQQYYNVATAAAITGYVRGMMMEASSTADTPLYGDTDSIAAVGVKIPISDKLGDWDLEGECDYAAIGGKKLYAFHLKGRPWRDNRPGEINWKIACKGARLKASQIRGIAQGGATIWESHSPTFSMTGGQRFIQRRVRMT